MYLVLKLSVIFQSKPSVIEKFAPGIMADMNSAMNDLKGSSSQGSSSSSGWDHMMKFDHYSVRTYMSTVYRPSAELCKQFQLPDAPIPTDVINWYETRDSGTGMFDRSLTEYVLEAIAFGWHPDPNQKVEWFCIAYVLPSFSSIMDANAPLVKS
jgi:hypothetical protein